MLADTIEAACHTLENPTPQRLEKFIAMLTSKKVEEGMLNNCNLTFRDLSIIQEAFVTLLSGYYHNRIKYQNQQDPDDKPKEEAKDAEKAKEADKTKEDKE